MYYLNKSAFNFHAIKRLARLVWHKNGIVQIAELCQHIQIGLVDDKFQGILLLRSINAFQNKLNGAGNKFLIKFL